MWFIGVEVEQETSAPLPKKNPGSAPVVTFKLHMKATNHPIDSTKSMHAQHFVWLRSIYATIVVLISGTFVRAE